MATLEEAFELIKKNNRVCPQPYRWQELYEMLHDKQREEGGREPPLPIVLGAWWHSSELQKMMCLQEHIKIALELNCLDEVFNFLSELPETDWHHIGRQHIAEGETHTRQNEFSNNKTSTRPMQLELFENFSPTILK